MTAHNNSAPETVTFWLTSLLELLMQAQPHCWNEQNLITGAYDQQLSNNRLINEW